MDRVDPLMVSWKDCLNKFEESLRKSKFGRALFSAGAGHDVKFDDLAAIQEDPSAAYWREPNSNSNPYPNPIPNQPSMHSSMQLGMQPTTHPTTQPTLDPSTEHVSEPPSQPSVQSSSRPFSQPSMQPSMQGAVPSGQPSSLPPTPTKMQPMMQPSSVPSVHPSSEPSIEPSQKPSLQPSVEPSTQPSSQPSRQRSSRSSSQRSCDPSSLPSGERDNLTSLKPIDSFDLGASVSATTVGPYISSTEFVATNFALKGQMDATLNLRIDVSGWMTFYMDVENSAYSEYSVVYVTSSDLTAFI